MKAIQLLAIVKSNVLQKYGPDVILNSTMNDIRKLESVWVNEKILTIMFILSHRMKELL